MRQLIDPHKDDNSDLKISSNRFVRLLLIIAGTLSLGFGILGIFLPVLPTTPFLLLSIACYSRSSMRFYKWLLNNKWFGNYLKNYRSGKGVPVRIKVWALLVLWLSIAYSAFVIIDNLIVRIGLILIALFSTYHILKIRTFKNKEINN